MITSKLQIIAAAILMVGSALTPVLLIQKTVNACWKQLPENFWKTIRGSSKRSDLLEKGQQPCHMSTLFENILTRAASRNITV